MLYAINLTTGDYLWDDIGAGDDLETFLNYVWRVTMLSGTPQFAIDGGLSVKHPSSHKEYVVLFVDKYGNQLAKIGTLKSIREENEIDYIEQIFDPVELIKHTI